MTNRQTVQELQHLIEEDARIAYKIAVVKAFVHGAIIEAKSKHPIHAEAKWEETDSPGWMWDCSDYRIQPQIIEENDYPILIQRTDTRPECKHTDEEYFVIHNKDQLSEEIYYRIIIRNFLYVDNGQEFA
jgi:hypothetical protein